MSFVGLPLAAVLGVAAATALTVVALYLLKSTPKPQPVSNVDFWLKAVEQAKPSWVFSTKIPVIALLLTLLVALLLVFLAGDPRLDDEASTTTVIIVDAGRTMEISHDGQRRFDGAIEILEDRVARATRTGQVAVVRAGVRPRVILPLTRDPHELDSALEGHVIDQGPSDLTAAVSLADSIVARRPGGDDARILVISDRHPATTARRAPMTVLPVGAPGQSVAIVAFGARRDPTAMGEYGVYCEVRSFAAKNASARLIIRDRDDVLTEEQLDLEPGKRVVHRTRGYSSDVSELYAVLEEIEIEGSADGLETDNVGFAVVEPLARTKALLVTDGNRYLEAVLRVNPTLEFEQVSPAQYASVRAGDFDVVIFDGHLPPGPLRHPGVLLVSPPERSDVVRFGPAVRDVAVNSTLASHPVLDAIDLEAVSVQMSRTLLPEPEDRALFRSDRHVLATAREGAGHRRVVLGFDLDATDLVRRPAFPLLMHNTVVWLANQEVLARSARHPGEPLRLPGQMALVELPSGDDREARGGVFYDTGSVGIYRINERPQAVSAVDFSGPISSSSLRPAETQTLMTEPPISLLLAIIVLVMIATEWFLLHRGRV